METRNMKMINGIPRRARIDLYVPSEAAIAEAVKAVESYGAHPLLTEAVVLLDQAQNKVADYVDMRSDESSLKQLFLFSPEGEKQSIAIVRGEESGTLGCIEIITEGEKTRWMWKVSREKIKESDKPPGPQSPPKPPTPREFA